MSRKNISRYGVAFIFLAAALGISGSIFMFTKSAADKVRPVNCKTTGLNHKVQIKDNVSHPESIDANICDRLTIINLDDRLRLIAFGLHDEHIYYDGVAEKTISQDEQLTVTLSREGTYLFHDHLDEKVMGKFNVR